MGTSRQLKAAALARVAANLRQELLKRIEDKGELRQNMDALNEFTLSYLGEHCKGPVEIMQVVLTVMTSLAIELKKASSTKIREN